MEITNVPLDEDPKKSAGITPIENKEKSPKRLVVHKPYYVTCGGSPTYISLTAKSREGAREAHLPADKDSPSLGVTSYDTVKISEPNAGEIGSVNGHLAEGNSTGYSATGVTTA